MYGLFYSGNNIGYVWVSNNVVNIRFVFNMGIVICYKVSILFMMGSNMLNICVFEIVIKFNSMYVGDVKYGINVVGF